MLRTTVLAAILAVTALTGLGASFAARADDRPGNCMENICERRTTQGNTVIITTDYYDAAWVNPQIGWTWVYSHSTLRAIMAPDERFEP